MQQVHVVPGVGLAPVQHALGDHGPPAALAGDQQDLVAGPLQEPGGGDAHGGVVALGEGVVEEDDPSPCPRARVPGVLTEPGREGLGGEGGQAALGVDA